MNRNKLERNTTHCLIKFLRFGRFSVTVITNRNLCTYSSLIDALYFTTIIAFINIFKFYANLRPSGLRNVDMNNNIVLCLRTFVLFSRTCLTVEMLRIKYSRSVCSVYC